MATGALECCMCGPVESRITFATEPPLPLGQIQGSVDVRRRSKTGHGFSPERKCANRKSSAKAGAFEPPSAMWLTGSDWPWHRKGANCSVSTPLSYCSYFLYKRPNVGRLKPLGGSSQGTPSHPPVFSEKGDRTSHPVEASGLRPPKRSFREASTRHRARASRGSDFELEAQSAADSSTDASAPSDGAESRAEGVAAADSERDSSAQRFRIIVATAIAFVICNMDKVNMSVAIIPMSKELGWSTATAGVVQSSFFWGYALSPLPGGWLAQRFTGRRVLRWGVFVWSFFTAVIPGVAHTLPALLFSRLLVGLGEGVAPPAATDLIARTVPKEERSRSTAMVFGGLNIGSVLGLLLAPVCITYFGWESVFYVFGIAGMIWVAVFGSVTKSTPGAESASPAVPAGSNGAAAAAGGGNGAATPNGAVTRGNHPASKSKSQGVPWGEFLRSPAVLALMWAHFCNDWGKYSLQSWLPTFYSNRLHLSLTNASLITILQPLASVAFSAVAASLADSLISSGSDTSQVRKLCQSVAFLAPAGAMALVMALGTSLPTWFTVGVLTAGTGLSSFALAGLYCTHQDISPKYAGILLGITNTAGAVPGFLGTALTGFLFDYTKSWNLALFAPSIFFYLAGTVVWMLFASSRPQDFDSMAAARAKQS